VGTIIGSGLESFLHQQVREYALNRIAEAKEEAARIVVQAEQETKKLKELSEARTAQMIEGHRQRELAQARLKARQTVMRRQEELLRQVWAAAASRLQEPIEPARRRSLLKRLIVDAVEQLGGGALEVQVSAEDQQLCTPELVSELSDTLGSTYGAISIDVLGETIGGWGGVVVTVRGAHQLVNNTLEERFALAQRYLRDEVFRLLAGASRCEGKSSPVSAASR